MAKPIATLPTETSRGLWFELSENALSEVIAPKAIVVLEDLRDLGGGASSVPLTPPAFVVQQNRLSRAIIFRKSERTSHMATIDVDELREYLRDRCGTAAFGGFPAALLDLGEIESLSGQELCRKAEQLGVDLREFTVGD